MKKFKITQLIIILAVLFSTAVTAQQNNPVTIYVESTRFATPLLERWASEYEKGNPEVEIVITKESSEKIDLSLVSFVEGISAEDFGQPILYAGRYALLPVTNADNPLLEEIGRKGLNKDQLENLIFEKGVLAGIDDPSSAKFKHEVTIYSGHKPESFGGTVAAHFGYSTADIRGRKISGDDFFLIHAVRKDPSGITFNSLSYIFDIETRQLKEELAILPLDVKKHEREVLQEGDIDEIIALVEKGKNPLIPVENFGFVYKDDNRAVKEFLRWILSEGQRFNHDYGFLQTEETVLTAQLKGI